MIQEKKDTQLPKVRIKRKECQIEIEAERESVERIDTKLNAHDVPDPLQVVLHHLYDLIHEKVAKKTLEMNMTKTRGDVIEAETVVEIVTDIHIDQTRTRSIIDISFQVDF